MEPTKTPIWKLAIILPYRVETIKNTQILRDGEADLAVYVCATKGCQLQGAKGFLKGSIGLTKYFYSELEIYQYSIQYRLDEHKYSAIQF